MSAGCSEKDMDGPEARGALTKMVIRLFAHWGLSESDQLELLGLSTKSRNLLSRYAKGEALPQTRESLDRICWLLSIHKALRLLYPQNPEIRYSWVNRRNTPSTTLLR